MKQQLLSIVIYVLTTVIGAVAFLYPFWQLTLPKANILGQAHSNDAALILTLLVGICFIVLLLEVQSQSISTKLIALLGILVSINAILRFAEVAIPAPGGFSPIFFLIVLTGYVYGSRVGFLMGALTLFVSALITGAVGPWLPYQMFTAGWVGMSAPICRPTVWLFKGEGKWLEVLVLASFGAFWGLVYGIIMNVWFWPFATGPASQYWQPGISLVETLERYAVFYLATSLVWDSMRSIGNVIFILAFGLPTLQALRRFHKRFTFSYQPVYEPLPPIPAKEAA